MFCISLTSLTARLRQELAVSTSAVACIVYYRYLIVLNLVASICFAFYGVTVITQAREQLIEFQMDSWDVYCEMIREARQRQYDIMDLEYHFFIIELSTEVPEGRDKYRLQEGMEASRKASERASHAGDRLTDLLYTRLFWNTASSPKSVSEEDSQAMR